ncbi:MAG: hypothetical protein JNJ94_05200 [Chlorobi bacterium]|nr:hypothetical protein [Chlorobiota bacterium]
MSTRVSAIRVALVLLLLVGVAPLLKSQTLPKEDAPPPCPSNCTDTTAWIYYTGATSSIPGCVIEVSFWYRYACGNYVFSIADITVYGSGCNFDSAMKYAIIGIIQGNPMGFPPIEGECADNIKVTNSACWKEFQEVITPTFSKTHYQPCSSNQCCYVVLRVCQNNGVRTANVILYGTPPVVNCTPDCPNYSCEAQQNTYPPVGSMIKPQEEEKREQLSVAPSNKPDLPFYLVNPTPTDSHR